MGASAAGSSGTGVPSSDGSGAGVASGSAVGAGSSETVTGCSLTAGSGTILVSCAKTARLIIPTISTIAINTDVPRLKTTFLFAFFLCCFTLILENIFFIISLPFYVRNYD